MNQSRGECRHQWEAVDIVREAELEPSVKVIRFPEDPSGIFQIFLCGCDAREAQEVPDRVFN